jgi:hypothetical protein
MIRTVVNKNGILLQNEPIFTEIQPVQIAYSDMLSSSKYTPDTLFQDKTKEKSFLKNYSLSLWLFINNQSASSSTSYTKETTLFKYGYIDTTTTAGTTTNCFKPQITYDQSENSYFVYMTNYTEDTKETVRYRLSTMPSQRWNHFVFNYNNNTADLFINGNLERTFSFPDNVPIYSSSDIMTIGDTNGVQGAICNVSYHDVVLTGSEIKKMHAIYSVSNPPIQPLR